MQTDDNQNRTLRGPRQQRFPRREPRMAIKVIVPTRKFVPPSSPPIPYVYPQPKPSIERRESKTELLLNQIIPSPSSSTKIIDEVRKPSVQKKKLPPRPPPKKPVPVIYSSSEDEAEEENDDFIYKDLSRKMSVHDITLSDDDDDDDDDEEEEEEEEEEVIPPVKPLARQVSLPPIPKISAPSNNSLPPIPTISAPGYSSDEDNNVIPTICVPGGFSDDEDVVPKKKKLDAIYNALYCGVRCDGCDGPVSGQTFKTNGKHWHPDCFKCQSCRQNLVHIAYYENKGLPYCALDYHELFSPRCDFCKTPIEEHSISALGKTYHAGHFFCRECGTPFKEESNIFEHDGHAYCEKDYYKQFGKTCKGCEELITDTFLVALGSDWHKECFVCADCGGAFSSSTFLVKGGKPYCEDHYDAKKPKQLPLKNTPVTTKKSLPSIQPDEKMCHKCVKPIQGRLVSAFGYDYHPLHFQCSTCNKLLSARIAGKNIMRYYLLL
ncbi:uncharacterized protein EV154DRAFT_513393 [Mucor mucedo]|uniref:uncharacterized protein n=1 Tax=Mucor mucedo TaxID=29922 RepID=UPI00221F0016|nr:uncharacterized protein EV154DRAFT_513393 [Mucor mucedo]KAI7889789.1 hypothetical protein EV154DRAFT_513393 [Mucor mucedo]